MSSPHFNTYLGAALSRASEARAEMLAELAGAVVRYQIGECPDSGAFFVFRFELYGDEEPGEAIRGVEVFRTNSATEAECRYPEATHTRGDASLYTPRFYTLES